MRFVIGRHSTRPVDIVEIYDGEGHFVATLYPGDTDDEIRVVSKYLEGVLLDERFPPYAVIKLGKG